MTENYQEHLKIFYISQKFTRSIPAIMVVVEKCIAEDFFLTKVFCYTLSYNKATSETGT